MNELIQWPRAKYWTTQWNPIIGCKPCSPACENCYAAAWARRFGQSFEPHRTNQKSPRTGVVFCGNMTDLFGEWLRPIDSMYFVTCAGNGDEFDFDATYLWLTKRVEEMCWTLNNMPRVRSNHYFGFTAENHHLFSVRTHQMAGMFDNFNIWLSAEPLLGPIDLKDCYAYDGGDYKRDVIPFKWLVVGCESGPNRRPCKMEWVESIVEQCLAANVPVFVKQICLLNGKFTNKIEEFPEHLRIRQVPWATTKEGV